MLEILIPTYSRTFLVNSNINHYRQLLKKSTDLSLSILDNDTPNADYAFGPLFEFGDRFRFIKNETNIGGAKNILNAIKLSRCQYTWILPDDVIPKIRTILAILTELKTNPAWILFKNQFHRERIPCDCKQIIIYHCDMLYAATWLPTLIHKTDILQSQLENDKDTEKIQNSYPHFSLFLSSLCNVVNRSETLSVFPMGFNSMEHHDHRYSYIHGAVVQLTVAINKNLPSEFSNILYKKLVALDEFKKNIIRSFPYEVYQYSFTDSIFLYRKYQAYFIFPLLLKLFFICFPEKLYRCLIVSCVALLNPLSTIKVFRKVQEKFITAHQRLSRSKDF